MSSRKPSLFHIDIRVLFKKESWFGNYYTNIVPKDNGLRTRKLLGHAILSFQKIDELFYPFRILGPVSHLL
jgi:hypothetical protein